MFYCLEPILCTVVVFLNIINIHQVEEKHDYKVSIDNKNSQNTFWSISLNLWGRNFFSIEKWFFHQSVVFGSRWSDKNFMIMRREKRGRNHASVYSSRKKGGHLRRIYMTGRKREKTCMRWQVGDLFTLKIITV